MADLTVTLVQLDIQWHEPALNRERIDQLLASHGAVGDLIVLPEMFTTGFTMDSAGQAEDMEGPTRRWMAALARQYDAVVSGTLAVSEVGQHFNRLLWQRPDGAVEHYDKRHLFRMADEHTAYTAGTARPVFTLNDWRIRPIICYDLRFPAWCRARHNDYDALLCPANWPDPRHNAWLTLLDARAIENQACVIANNRVGTDAHSKRYLGNSKLIDAKGHTVSDAGSVEGVVTATLSKAELDRFRARFPVYRDADEFELT